MTYQDHIPVNVITGFLGSGKTTLLQRLLDDPGMADAAVLINEFGEIGLDHHLLQRVDEQTVVLKSGCLCCTIRGDLSEALRGLYSRRERGEIPKFRRLVLETTGLADPAPIIYTLMAEDVIRHHFRLGNVITTVDAVNGRAQLRRHGESLKQAAMADRLVITKTDLASGRKTASLRAKLKALNPSAPLFAAAADPISAEALFTRDVYDPKSKSAEVARWIDAEAFAATDEHAHDVNRHGDGITAFCLTFDEPLDWTAFGVWLTMLLQCHGQDVLRVKGLLNVLDAGAPVAVHGVQHIVHPPVHLDAWPDADRRSRLVFIVQGLRPEDIEASLLAFNGLANSIAA